MMSKANSFCLIDLPALLSEANVWRFREAFPEHTEIIDRYWQRKRVINVDKILSRDAGILLNIIEQCKNLKEVKFTGPEKRSTNFKQLPAAIVSHCPTLEVLDIPRIPLTDEDLSSLSSLVTLKSIRINLDAVTRTRTVLDLLFLNNQQLEDVYIIRVPTDVVLSFKKMPKSVVKLVTSAKSSQLGDLFEHIDKWRLETLWLVCHMLSTEEVISVSKLTTLKSFNLKIFVCTDGFLRLLSNNPNLEEVILSENISSTVWLGSLPKTVKILKPSSYKSADPNILIECAATLKLVSLRLSCFSGNVHNNLPCLVAAVPLLEHLTFNCLFVNADAVQFFQQLKQLKTLKLIDVWIDFNEALTEIMSSCLKLEVVKLYYVRAPLSQNVLDAIANLPLLKEINFTDNFENTNYTNFMQNLSKSRNLTTATFIKCENFTKNDALILIRGSKTLRYLWIDSPNITDDFVHDTVRELNEQKNRQEALFLTVSLENDMTSQDLHPKLELITYPKSIPF